MKTASICEDDDEGDLVCSFNAVGNHRTNLYIPKGLDMNLGLHQNVTLKLGTADVAGIVIRVSENEHGNFYYSIRVAANNVELHGIEGNALEAA